MLNRVTTGCRIRDESMRLEHRLWERERLRGARLDERDPTGRRQNIGAILTLACPDSGCGVISATEMRARDLREPRYLQELCGEVAPGVVGPSVGDVEAQRQQRPA